MLKRVWPVYGQAIQENFGVKLSVSEVIELSHILNKVLGQGEGTEW